MNSLKNQINRHTSCAVTNPKSVILGSCNSRRHTESTKKTWLASDSCQENVERSDLLRVPVRISSQPESFACCLGLFTASIATCFSRWTIFPGVDYNSIYYSEPSRHRRTPRNPQWCTHETLYLHRTDSRPHLRRSLDQRTASALRALRPDNPSHELDRLPLRREVRNYAPVVCARTPLAPVRHPVAVEYAPAFSGFANRVVLGESDRADARAEAIRHGTQLLPARPGPRDRRDSSWPLLFCRAASRQCAETTRGRTGKPELIARGC